MTPPSRSGSWRCSTTSCGTAALTDDEVREIRRIKARVERERIPPSDDPKFHLKLGRGGLSDVEFTAQLLQLQHGVRETATIRALDRLRDASDPRATRIMRR